MGTLEQTFSCKKVGGGTQVALFIFAKIIIIIGILAILAKLNFGAQKKLAGKIGGGGKLSAPFKPKSEFWLKREGGT